jgi:hypothetical protein
MKWCCSRADRALWRAVEGLHSCASLDRGQEIELVSPLVRQVGSLVLRATEWSEERLKVRTAALPPPTAMRDQTQLAARTAQIGRLDAFFPE